MNLIKLIAPIVECFGGYRYLSDHIHLKHIPMACSHSQWQAMNEWVKCQLYSIHVVLTTKQLWRQSEPYLVSQQTCQSSSLTHHFNTEMRNTRLRLTSTRTHPFPVLFIWNHYVCTVHTMWAGDGCVPCQPVSMPFFRLWLRDVALDKPKIIRAFFLSFTTGWRVGMYICCLYLSVYWKGLQQ